MDISSTAIRSKNSLRESKKPYSLNSTRKLFDREVGFRAATELTHNAPAWHLNSELELLKSFTPNFTIQNVDKAMGYMRKFTPDGRLLLSFSHDQRALDIYEFRGVGAVADLLESQHNECITAADHSQQSLHIRQQVFQRLLVRRRSIRLTSGGASGHLNREFSIFIGNGHYVLLAAMGISLEGPSVEHVVEYPDLFNECDLYFYHLYLVDLQQLRLSDIYVYKCDSIQLSHNHGVSIFGYTMAVFSKYRQSIDIIEIVDGKFQKLYTIGPTGARHGEPYIYCQQDACVATFSVPLTHLKQRILAYIYRMYTSYENEEQRRQKLKEFYRDFPKYEKMVISKMQLVDSDHLLIRYEQPLRFNIPLGLHVNPFKLYVFYCISTETIVKLYFQNSYELLHILRDHCDVFRNVRSRQTQRAPSSSSNSTYLYASFNDTASSLVDPPQCLNTTLPISTQSFSASPYLDYSLFRYDDRQISALERPKISNMEPLCFRDRQTGRCLFRLHLEPLPPRRPAYNEDDLNALLNTSDSSNASTPSRSELVAFIFHPYEPFIISIQKLSQRYVVNFHIYNKSTVVTQ